MTLRAILRRLGRWLREPENEQFVRRIREQAARQEYDMSVQMETRGPQADKVKPESAGPSASRALSKPWDRGKA